MRRSENPLRKDLEPVSDLNPEQRQIDDAQELSSAKLPTHLSDKSQALLAKVDLKLRELARGNYIYGLEVQGIETDDRLEIVITGQLTSYYQKQLVTQALLNLDEGAKIRVMNCIKVTRP